MLKKIQSFAIIKDLVIVFRSLSPSQMDLSKSIISNTSFIYFFLNKVENSDKKFLWFYQHDYGNLNVRFLIQMIPYYKRNRLTIKTGH